KEERQRKEPSIEKETHRDERAHETNPLRARERPGNDRTAPPAGFGRPSSSRLSVSPRISRAARLPGRLAGRARERKRRCGRSSSPRCFDRRVDEHTQNPSPSHPARSRLGYGAVTRDQRSGDASRATPRRSDFPKGGSVTSSSASRRDCFARPSKFSWSVRMMSGL